MRELTDEQIRAEWAAAGGVRYHPPRTDKGKICVAMIEDLYLAMRRSLPASQEPIPMVLFCPMCGVQHIDEVAPGYTNPPHRSHLCSGCGCIWRPADVATVGVARIDTRGEHDNFDAGKGRTLDRLSFVTIHPMQADALAAQVQINPRDRIDAETEHRRWLLPPGELRGFPINQADEE